ncbi:MAG: hypothetical protein QOC82_3386 [Frankiaceae bacterium]|nr:hypothetical protein [Frankiaceae bacterium]
MGGLSTDAATTIVNRDQSRVDSILNASAEYVKSLPYQSCSGGATTITTQVPHDSAFTATFGPAVAFSGAVSCSAMQRVPVTVTGNGFTVTLDVVKRS